MSTATPLRRRVPLLARLILGAGLGMVVGSVLGARVAPLGELGVLVVRFLKALATPLVFLAIVDSLGRTELPLKQGLRLLLICALNTMVAGSLAIALATTLRPGIGVPSALFAGAPAAPVAPVAHPSPLGVLSELVPESVFGPMLKNEILSVVLLAILCGSALRRLRREQRGKAISELVEDGLAITTRLLGWLIELVPIAIFGVVAKVVGTAGFAVFLSLGQLVGTVALGLVLHVALYYSLLVFALAGRSPWAFWRAAGEALLTALGTGSSMATLPITLRTLEQKLGVNRGSARLAACIGTNFNNDGIMLYEVVAAIFVAQAAGITLSPEQLVSLALTSAVAAAGIAGVPEAGLITLSLVLSAADLPMAALPLLLTVDWLLGRLRAATNVASDLTIATVLDRFAPPEQEVHSP